MVLLSEVETQFIQHCLQSEWLELPDLPSPCNLSHLLAFLSELHQERVDRILATCLLYCSRYADTGVSVSSKFEDMRMMKINLENIPGSDPPVGSTVSGLACSHLAILYHWSCPRSSASTSGLATTGGQRNSRKISASLALERKMLSIVDVFAVIPLPK